jgi:hypothetical protein
MLVLSLDMHGHRSALSGRCSVAIMPEGQEEEKLVDNWSFSSAGIAAILVGVPSFLRK